MAVGEPLGHGCWNTPRIVEYFVTWHMMKWLFWRLFPASGGPLCFLQSETVIQTNRRDFLSCLCDEILTNFWSHFGSLGQGFLRPPFWTRRRPWGRGWDCLFVGRLSCGASTRAANPRKEWGERQNLTFVRPWDRTTYTRLSTSTTLEFQNSHVPRDLTPLYCWPVDMDAM